MIRKLIRRGGVVFGLVSTAKVAQIILNDEIDVEFYNINKKLLKIINWVTNSSVNTTNNVKPKVVVLGTGWGALSMLQHLDDGNIELTIVSPRSFFFYTPLLAGTAVGTLSTRSIIEPIRWYFNRTGHSGARFIQASCREINLTKKSILCTDIVGSSLNISYDHLVIAVGAEPATFNISGVLENAIFIKEAEDGLTIHRRILESLEAANALETSRDHSLSLSPESEVAQTKPINDNIPLVQNAIEEEIDRLLHWVVVGGGPTGVELSAEISDFVKKDVARYFPSLAPRIKVTLIEATDRILGAFDEHISAYAKNALISRHIEVLCNSVVTNISSDKIDMNQRLELYPSPLKTKISYGVLVWAGGLAMRPLVKQVATQIGPEYQKSKFGLEVDSKFRVKGIPDGSVWAVGDCAVMGCPPTAQAASQQGKYLGKLFRDTNFDKGKIEKYQNFKFAFKGALAYLGDGKGIAEIRGIWDHYNPTSGVVIEGAPAFVLWRGLYFSKLMSVRNQCQVAFDWVKTSVFGREIASPYKIDPTTVKTSKGISKK